MLVSMKLLHRCVVRAAIGCVFALALSGAAFSQYIECPITTNTTVSGEQVLFLGGASSCVVGSNAILTVPNGNDLLNESTKGGSVTMIIDGGSTLQNSGYFQNFASTSSAYLGSTVDNFGTIYNNANATLDITDGTLTNTSNLENFGTIDDETGGGGTLNNAGRLVNERNLVGNGGLIDVTTITNTVGASIENDASLSSSSLTNNGTLTNSDGTGAGMGIGTLTNNGTLTNQTYGDIEIYGSLQNNGTLTNSPNPTDINSEGTINLYGSLGNNTNGTLTNNGIISLASGASLTNQGFLVNNGGILSIAAGSTLNNLAGGTLTLTGSEQVIVDGTINSIPAVQLQSGALFGSGTINGNVNNMGALVAPGDESPRFFDDVVTTPGTLTINGSYTQQGDLDISLFGAAPGDYSVLDVSGLVTLDGGNLLFTLGNGFTPVAGDDFTFLDFGSLTGDFAPPILLGWNCPTGDVCDLVYGANSVSLDITAASSGGSGSGNTPEPSSLLLLSAAMLALIACSRAKRVAADA